MVEGGVVSGRIIGGYTPARGIGYLPDYPDDLGDEEEGWEASAIGDGGDTTAASRAGASEEVFSEEETTTVIAKSQSRPAWQVTSRSIVSVIVVVAFSGGVLVSNFGQTTRLRSALIGHAAVPGLPSALLRESPRSALVTAPLPTSPELASGRETVAPPVTTTVVAARDVSRTSAVNVHRKSPKRAQRPSPTGPTSAASWVDPFAD